MKRAMIATAAAAPLCLAWSAQAATIAGWNTNNVLVGPVVADGEVGASVIYDRNPAAPGAVTNGQIVYEAPEANAPGLKVVNGPFQTGGQTPTLLQGCIMASSTATCDSPRQSGKRFKNQITGTGPIDLVFDIGEPGDLASLPYQVYHRLINVSGQSLTGFTISLGTGVGAGFTASGEGDGLGFDPDFRLPGGLVAGGNATGANSQFPYGLFGGDDPSRIVGFFDDERSGFLVNFSEDVLTSNGFYGAYPDFFGSWLSQESVPQGVLWDDDNDPDTDALVMAWYNAEGELEARRTLDAAGEAIPLAPTIFESVAAFEAFLLAQVDASVGLADLLLVEDFIEDIANLNLNYAISLDGFSGSQFTLRIQGQGSEIAPIPLPMAAPLLMAGLGGLALIGGRRKAQAAA
jgi:hypothetical protein